MPLFVTPKDYLFMQGINQELVDQVIETPILFFGIDPNMSETNLYGESSEKVYLPGIECNAVITHDDQRTEDDSMGPNVFQNIICALERWVLKEKDFYPERGDVIKYFDAYYEITQCIDNQLIAGRVGLPHSIICTAVMVNRGSINVRTETGEKPLMGTSFNTVPRVKENFVTPSIAPGPAAEPKVYPSTKEPQGDVNAASTFDDPQAPDQNIMKPSDKGTGGDDLNERVNQIRNDENTSEKEYSVGYYDIDQSLGYYIESILKPTVVENNEVIKVPVFYGSPERWASAQSFGYYRDNKSKLILPLIMYRRTTVARNENILFPRVSQLYYTAARKWDSKTRYDNFYAKNINNAPTKTNKYSFVSLPNYVIITYEGIIWTSFVEQMNKVVEKFQFADNSYWGDPKKFKFRAQIDSFDTATELATDTERMVKSNFNITIYGYILTDAFNNALTTKSSFAVKKVVFTESLLVGNKKGIIPEAEWDSIFSSYDMDFNDPNFQNIDFTAFPE